MDEPPRGAARGLVRGAARARRVSGLVGDLHHLHHLRGRNIGNYANLAPWIDLLFDGCKTLEIRGMRCNKPEGEKVYLALSVVGSWGFPTVL